MFNTDTSIDKALHSLSVSRLYQMESPLPGKPLWQFSQAVQWVEVRAFAVSGQRLAVKLYPVYRLNAGLIQVSKGIQTGTIHNVTHWKGGDKSSYFHREYQTM